MRKRLVKKTGKKVGSSPGTLIHVGERKMEQIGIRVIDYDAEQLDDHPLRPEELARCGDFLEPPTVTWINLDGIHQVEVIETIGKCFNLHPLVLEDILNTEHRPKVEDYGDYLFIVLKMLHFDPDAEDIRTEQVSLILGRNFVLTFQEREGDVFDGVRDRIRNHKGRIRNMKADYLAYALLDSIVDSYYGILEKIGDRIEALEEEVITAPSPSTQKSIHHYKREMILLRKAIWPLREVVGGLQRGDSTLVGQVTGVFLRDVYDHTIQVIDTVETLRDIITGLLDLYLSSLSNRMNEVMKVLTIIATIFIPLSFFAGIYGMNFEYMPELHWPWAYPALWLLMLIAAGGMLLLFRRKKWL